MDALLTALRLQMLSNESDKGVMDKNGDINGDDMQDDVMEMTIDLSEVASDLLDVNASAKENEDNDGYIYENYGGPFINLLEFFINVLSFPVYGDAGAKSGVGGLISLFVTV